MPETRLLPVQITDEERRALGDTLARLYLEGKILEAEKKRIAGEYKTKIEEKAAAIGSISKILSSGLEDRYVEIREEIDRGEAVARVYRLDTFALIEVRPLSKRELEPPAPAPAPSAQQAEFFCSACAAPASTFRGRVFFCRSCFDFGEDWARSEAAASSSPPAPEASAPSEAPLAPSRDSSPPPLIVNLILPAPQARTYFAPSTEEIRAAELATPAPMVIEGGEVLTPTPGERGLEEGALAPQRGADLARMDEAAAYEAIDARAGELAQASAPSAPQRGPWYATPQEGWLTLEELLGNAADRPQVEAYRIAGKRAIKLLAEGRELADEALLLADPCPGCKTLIEDRDLFSHGCYLGAAITEAFRPALSQVGNAHKSPSERRAILVAEVKATLARGAQGIPTESDRRFTLCTDCLEVIDEIGLAYHGCAVVTDTRREVERVLDAGKSAVRIQRKKKPALQTLLERGAASSPSGEEGEK